MKPLTAIEEKFFLIQTKNPGWSSYTCFLNLIRGQKYTPEEVEPLFDKFVDKEDYANKIKQGLLEHANTQTWYGQQHLF